MTPSDTLVMRAWQSFYLARDTVTAQALAAQAVQKDPGNFFAYEVEYWVTPDSSIKAIAKRFRASSLRRLDSVEKAGGLRKGDNSCSALNTRLVFVDPYEFAAILKLTDSIIKKPDCANERLVVARAWRRKANAQIYTEGFEAAEQSHTNGLSQLTATSDRLERRAALLARARLRVWLGRKDGALQDIDEYIRLTPTPPWYWRAAHGYLRLTFGDSSGIEEIIGAAQNGVFEAKRWIEATKP